MTDGTFTAPSRCASYRSRGGHVDPHSMQLSIEVTRWPRPVDRSLVLL